MRPYNKLNKEVADFTEYSDEPEVLYTIKLYHLADGIDLDKKGTYIQCLKLNKHYKMSRY